LFYAVDLNTKDVSRYPFPATEFGTLLNKVPAMDSVGAIYAFTQGSPTVFRFNPTANVFDKVLDINESTGRPMLDPMLISKDGILYATTIFQNIEEEPNEPVVNQLISVNTITKEFTPLSFMQASTLFRPTVLYERKMDEVDIATITIMDTSVYESDGKAAVRIHLSKPLQHKLRLYYQTLNGTATSSNPNKDYNQSNGHVDFKKGAVDEVVRINIHKDKLSEPDEYFYVQLMNSNTDTIKVTDDQALITIHDGSRTVNSVSAAAAAVSRRTSTTGKNAMNNKTLHVTVSPNPSSTTFSLVINSNKLELAQVTVLDGMGRTASRHSAVPIGIPLVIGENFRPGIYFVKVQQGRERRTIKLIKQP
jgi:hypothetical protein